MPLKTETIDLLDEHARLDQRLDDLADQVADGDDVDSAIEDAQRVEQHLAGVQWALDHDDWPDDPTVEIGALTTGEMAEVRDQTAAVKDEAEQFGGHGKVDGAAQVRRAWSTPRSSTVTPASTPSAPLSRTTSTRSLPSGWRPASTTSRRWET